MRSVPGVPRGRGLGVAVFAALAAGCHQDLQLRPVRVGVTRIDLIGPRLLPRWEPLRIDLGLYLGPGRLLQFEVLTPRQIRVHLSSGREAFALVNATEYAEVSRGGDAAVLATAVNAAGKTERVGLIVTGTGSPIQSLADLKGKRFDFGPKGDPLLDTAAVCALARAGVRLSDIEKDKLLGRYHHIGSLEVARAVVYEKVPAGIVDAAEYEKWPPHGGSFLLGTVSRDQVRVLYRTEPVPEMAVVASKRADPALVEKVRKYFLEEINRKQLAVLSWLGVNGFVPADADRYAPFAKQVNEVYPPASQPDEMPVEP